MTQDAASQEEVGEVIAVKEVEEAGIK